MSNFFSFESDFVDSLRCIPMQVRLKLDTCGVKLKLDHWQKFSHEQRRSLLTLVCETEQDAKIYRQYLQSLVQQRTGTKAKTIETDLSPAWQNKETIPLRLQEKASQFGVELTIEQWGKLTVLQRFALIKLSRPSHENRNFYPAMQEFDLV